MVPSPNRKPLVEYLQLIDLPAAERYFIAYSGGMDSSALLHALNQMPELSGLLTAIHVNHNINTNSNQWANHCQIVCEQLNIPLISASIELDDHSEAACRQARQNVFQQHLGNEDCLLTAHHQNDQIETVLFRLFRGSGLKGLSGMMRNTQFKPYKIYRPLLSVNQSQIKKYVSDHQLKYIDDPSNQNNHYSRNHIRNLIVPVINEYDAQVQQNIDKTVQNLKHSHQLLSHLIGQDNPFDYQRFQSTELLSTALYHWLHNLSLQSPNRRRLKQFAHDCLQAANHKNPELCLDAYRLLRWHRSIYALKLKQAIDTSELNTELTAENPTLALANNGELHIESNHPFAFKATVKYQQNHKNIKLTENGQHKKLKNLFQENHIPPWKRQTMPYLYIDNQLMAVGSEIISYEFKQILSELNAEYQWLSSSHLL